MEQIYYTQCPIGYGLGATSGFQIKRKTAGYPASGDFRHLALRAFITGTRDLAPGTLRYRNDGGVFEIAWLTPRTHEYVAEDGRLWGRPGGQFAHGLRLTDPEPQAIHNWPAGLQGAAFWRTSDPVATLKLEPGKQEPDPVTISPADLLLGGDFGRVRELADSEPADWLAGLLVACAWAARESRTLFLIDQPERLGPTVALLTFAFPRALRGDLTFSTYHDRPEELAGFRIQGTVSAARPNRAALASLGVVADSESRTFDPVLPVPGWARRLAGWLKGRDAGSQQAWIETDRRASSARRPERIGRRWSDDWLEHLFGFHESVTPPVAIPTRPGGWGELNARTTWAANAGLAAEWTQAHDPSWWQAAQPQASDPSAREALRSLLRRAAAWKPPADARTHPTGLAARWGSLVAGWFAAPDELAAVTEEALDVAPDLVKGAFLAGLFQSLPRAEASQWVAQLKAGRMADDPLVLPVEAAQVAAAVRDGAAPDGWDQIITRALAVSEATASALEAIAGQVGADDSLIGQFAGLLATALKEVEPEARGWNRAWSWALARSDRLLWLTPFLSDVFSAAENAPGWERLRRCTRDEAMPALARVALAVAGNASSVAEALPWCVESLRLPSDRDLPADPSWADAYLDRVCGLDLVRWLFLVPPSKPDVWRWLKLAGRCEAIRARNIDRLQTARRFAEVLTRRSPLTGVLLPDVPEARRGDLVELLLEAFGDTRSAEFVPVLEACRLAWPGGFAPGSAGLDGIGRALARAMLREAGRPKEWLRNLDEVLKALGLPGPIDDDLEPDGLAAHIVAQTARRIENADQLRALRQAVFLHDGAWKALALDVRTDLAGAEPSRLDLAIGQWDEDLERPSPQHTTRFFELMFNVSDIRSMMALIAAKASELPGLDPVPWWAHKQAQEERDDVRDAFARLAPMEPLRLLEAEKFHRVRQWMESSGPQGVAEARLRVELMPEDEARVLRDDGLELGHLSPRGQARWRCLKALTTYDRQGQGALSRLQTVEGWGREGLPLADLEEEDRKQFVSAVIQGLTDFDPRDIGQQRSAEELAKWLVQSGVKSLGWLPTQRLADSRPLYNVLRAKINDETSGAKRREAARLLPPTEPGLSV